MEVADSLRTQPPAGNHSVRLTAVPPSSVSGRTEVVLPWFLFVGLQFQEILFFAHFSNFLLFPVEEASQKDKAVDLLLVKSLAF